MKEAMVYCTDCKYFLIKNEIPHCKFEGICNVLDCEDSKHITERPYFKPIPKLIYISHPYSAKEENKLKVEEIIRQLATEHPEHTYCSPIHCFSFMYNDFDYETGINMCLEVLKRCDMMYVYGDWWNSKGCSAEIDFCRNNGIPYKLMKDIDLHDCFDCEGCFCEEYCKNKI